MSNIDLSKVVTKDILETGLERSKGYMDDRLDKMKGVTIAYIRDGASLFSSDWLSLEVDGEAFVPEANSLYLILTDGEYFRNLMIWTGTMYKYATNVNIGDTMVAKVYVSTETKTSALRTQGWIRSNSGSNLTSFVVEDGDEITVSFRYAGSSMRVNFLIGIDGEPWLDNFWVYSNGDKTHTKTYTFAKKDAGKTFVVRFISESNDWSYAAGTLYAGTYTRKKFDVSYETLEYVKNTETDPGQSGLLPAAPAATPEDAVFTAGGTWKDRSTYMDGFVASELDITEEELDEIFQKTSADYSDYSGDETIIGNDFGETRYRRCVQFTNNTAVNGTVMEVADLSTWGIDKIRSLRGMQCGTNYSTPIPHVSISGGNIIYDSVYYDETAQKLYIETNRATATGRSGIIEVEYTKTSGV